MAETKRTDLSSDETPVFQRYFIGSSESQPPEEVAGLIRRHWSIENELHRVLDMAFQEDAARHRAGNCAQNFATLRHFALNLVKNYPGRRLGVANTGKAAGWDRNILVEIFMAPKKIKLDCPASSNIISHVTRNLLLAKLSGSEVSGSGSKSVSSLGMGERSLSSANKKALFCHLWTWRVSSDALRRRFGTSGVSKFALRTRILTPRVYLYGPAMRILTSRVHWGRISSAGGRSGIYKIVNSAPAGTPMNGIFGGSPPF